MLESVAIDAASLASSLTVSSSVSSFVSATDSKFETGTGFAQEVGPTGVRKIGRSEETTNDIDAPWRCGQLDPNWRSKKAQGVDGFLPYCGDGCQCSEDDGCPASLFRHIFVCHSGCECADPKADFRAPVWSIFFFDSKWARSSQHRWRSEQSNARHATRSHAMERVCLDAIITARDASPGGTRPDIRRLRAADPSARRGSLRPGRCLRRRAVRSSTSRRRSR